MSRSPEDEQLRGFRRKYNDAVFAHAQCLREVTLASIRGDKASPEAIEAEAAARTRMDLARRTLYAAMRQQVG